MTRSYRVGPLHLTLFTGSLLVLLPWLFGAAIDAQGFRDDTRSLESEGSIAEWADDVPAHVSHVEGEAWLERDGVAEGSPVNVPLLTGDRLRTRQGHLEVLFSDASVITLDAHTDAELLSDNFLRLSSGRLRLDLSRAAGPSGYRIDAEGTTAWIRAAGEYRIEVDARAAAPVVRLLVARGLAELQSTEGQTLVRAGYEATASPDRAPSLPYAVAVNRWDGFDRWWDERRLDRVSLAGSRHLPVEMTHYSGELDRAGDWQYESTHGYVWYPRVTDDWVPYSSGRWSWVGSYGWVWIGADQWAWPTHHYGRWGIAGGRYFWIPGRTWAPAWVAWASSPAFVGWVPLGVDNRALISVSVAFESGWRGWTYAPAHSFSGRAVTARRNAYAPPRNVAISDRYRGPGRPEGMPAGRGVGVRGPANVARGTTAVPRRDPMPRGPAPGISSASSPRSVGTRTDAAPDRGPSGRERNTAIAPSSPTTPPRPPATRQGSAPRPSSSQPSGGPDGTQRLSNDLPSRTRSRGPLPSAPPPERSRPSPPVGWTPPTSATPRPERALPPRPTPPERAPEARPGVRQRNPQRAPEPSAQPEASNRTPRQSSDAPTRSGVRAPGASRDAPPRAGVPETGTATGGRAAPRRRD